MNAQAVIDLAKSSELKQVVVKKDDNAILGFLNLGMLELYKRFPLREAEAVITLRDGKTMYTLDVADADVSMEANSEVLVIVGAYTVDKSGDIVETTINDEDSVQGINTPSYNVVEVPAVATGAQVSIIYRVSPVFLTSLQDPVPIPPQLLEALLNYIGYKGYEAVDGTQKVDRVSHYTRFENSCTRVILEGLISTDDLISKKLYDRGFI